MTEEWRAALGWEGLYEVSSLGRVRTLTRRANNVSGHRHGRQGVRGRLLLPTESDYLRVTLFKDGVAKHCAVHILALEAFVGSRPPGMVARHFPSRDIRDNRLSNLRWGTPAENQADRIIHGTSNHGKPNPYRTNSTIETMVRAEYGSAGRYKRGRITQRALAEKYGVSLGCINRIIHGGQGCLS